MCSVVSNSLRPMNSRSSRVGPQAPLSMGLHRQEYWTGLPFPPPGDLPNPGVERMSPALASGFFTTEPPESPCKPQEGLETAWSQQWSVSQVVYSPSLPARQPGAEAKVPAFRKELRWAQRSNPGQWQRNGTAKVMAVKMFEKLQDVHPVPRQFS